VEQRCYDPAINSRFFPKTPPKFFWSSSPYASYAYGAWYVYFSFGGVGYYSKSYAPYVRLVRGGQ